MVERPSNVSGKLVDALADVGAGEVLGVVEESGEAAGGAALVGDVEEVVDALLDAWGGDGAAVGVFVETFALATAAAAGDDFEDVVGADASDLLLGVFGGNEVDAGVEDPEDLEHGVLGFFLGDVGAFAGEGGFVDEVSGEVAGGGAGGVEGGEVGGVGQAREGGEECEEAGADEARGVYPRSHGFLLKAEGGRAHFNWVALLGHHTG